MKKVLLALGGNALGNDPKEQEELTRKTSKTIVDLVEEGYRVVVTHGNGPQVGMINLALENDNIPLPECIAMSQGYIGYHLQKGIREELLKRNLKNEVITIPTQVLVDENDSGFTNPTKPIGAFYTEEEKNIIEKERPDYIIKNDSNRGFRRYVASPRPLDIIEFKTINQLVEENNIVIAGGGGGVPVIKKDDLFIGVPGVVDKDFTSSLLARMMEVDIFVILTQVDKVSINFGKENEIALDAVNIDELKGYMANKEFGEGSMLPKIEASMEFVIAFNNKNSIITSIEKVSKALKGEEGTFIKFK